MDFAAAVNLHLSAIGRRDLDGYLATVHPDVSLIMPDGRLLTGPEEVAAFHRDWFADRRAETSYRPGPGRSVRP